MVEEDVDVVEEEHVRVQEHVVPDPSGQFLKVIDIEDEVDVKEHIIRHAIDDEAVDK